MAGTGNHFFAARAAVSGRTEMHSIDRAEEVNDDECQLKTTHILSIPLPCGTITNRRNGALVSMTVDLRLPFFRGMLLQHRRIFEKTPLYHRARMLGASGTALVRVLETDLRTTRGQP
jgi:hypothetical protein